MNAHQRNPSPADTVRATSVALTMKVSSTGFKNQSKILQRYSCQGENISPDLAWSSAPDGTKSIALVCEDPDAPHGTFIHWVMYNIPSSETGLAENIPQSESLPDGARQGQNGAGKVGYTGPCPPPGKPHRYYFRLYALDTQLAIAGDVTRDKLMSATQGHVLAKGELLGIYQRQ